jgi:plasmid stability protein
LPLNRSRIDRALPLAPAMNTRIALQSPGFMPAMASITIRNLDQHTKDRLRVRAAHHKRSMEEEARIILKMALMEKSSPAASLADSIAEIVRPLGGIEIELPGREPPREPPRFPR